MQNAFFYLLTVLIWGSTWLAIKFQLGVVSPELSVAYRFFLASALIFAYSLVRKLPLKFTREQHLFMLLQGALLFSINYILVYFAEVSITSGLVAVIFSLVIVFNVLFGALFLKRPVDVRVLIGGLVGIGGLALIFWPELSDFSLTSAVTLGLLFAVISSLSASLGNIVSARNQANGLPVIQTNAYSMGYGALITLLIALIRGAPLTLEFTPAYLGSLLYLALFGSVIAFGSYLTLLGRIGPDRAAYSTIVFPVVALLLSALFESMALDVTQFGGVGLILLGNVVVLTRPKPVVMAKAN
jgi:drug/metabolite transporter (DMT)-like permease